MIIYQHSSFPWVLQLQITNTKNVMHNCFKFSMVLNSRWPIASGDNCLAAKYCLLIHHYTCSQTYHLKCKDTFCKCKKVNIIYYHYLKTLWLFSRQSK